MRISEDVDAWAFERNGLYSVRSCYRLIKEESDQQEAFELNDSGASTDQRWCIRVWKLKVPPKVRIF